MLFETILKTFSLIFFNIYLLIFRIQNNLSTLNYKSILVNPKDINVILPLIKFP